MSHADLERPVPQNIDAERSLLGAVLLDNRTLDDIAQLLQPADFFHAHHRKIYEHMLAIAEDRDAIDLVTLTACLERHKCLEAAGGAGYIAQLMDGVPHVTNVEYYVEIVRDSAILRNLIHATHVIQQSALDAEEDPQAILDRAERMILEIADRKDTSELAPVAEVVRENLLSIEQLLKGEQRVPGLETGYAQLDSLLAGLHPGNVAILAARPSIGKTALALNIAENVAKRSKTHKTAFFSLEMTKAEVLHRLVASHAHIDLHKFRTGHLSSDEGQRITKALIEIGEWPLFIDDANPSTVAEMNAKARRLKRHEGLSLVIVDYLQLVSATRAKFSNRNEEVSATSRAFKAMARGLNVPLLVLSQLTRSSEKEERRPQLSDLRDSGAIEQDADVVMFIHRPKAFAVGESQAERNRGEIVVAKQRNGPTDAIKMAFLAPWTRFEELAPEMFDGD